MSTEIVLSPAPELRQPALFAPMPKAAKRVLEFFKARSTTITRARLYNRRQDEISLDEVENIAI